MRGPARVLSLWLIHPPYYRATHREEQTMVALQEVLDRPLAPALEASNRPTPKVVAATGGSAVGVALSTVVSWAVVQYCPVVMPDDVNKAVTFLIITGLTAAFTFVCGYITRPSQYDTILLDPETGRPRTCRARPIL